MSLSGGRKGCPDDGTCHHGCILSCWRVATCVPLTASGWDDWPDEVKAANPPVPRLENVLLASVGADREPIDFFRHRYPHERPPRGRSEA